MKKRIDGLVIALIWVASAALFSCGDAKSRFLQDLSVKDFSSYKGIGIGYKTADEKSPKARRLGPKAEQKNDEANYGLLGLDLEGKLSALSFLGKDGKNASQDYRLTNYRESYPFIWLGFEPVNGSFDFDPNRGIGHFNGWNGDTEFFLFSLNTGKIYYNEKLPEGERRPDYLVSSKFPVLFSGGSGDEYGGKNCLYGDTFRFSEKDGNLVVENFENIRLLEPDASGKSDGFGAFGSADIYDNAIAAKQYVFLNVHKSVKKYNEVQFGYNQRLYVKQAESSPWQVIDEDGKEVDLQLQPNAFAEGWSRDTLLNRKIKDLGNVTYFAATKNIFGSYLETGEIHYSNGLIQVEWTQDSYIVTNIDVPGGLIHEDYVYYLDDGRVSRTNYISFEHELLLDGYIITTMWLDTFGRVNFHGTNEQLETVEGFINEDGTPNFDVTNEGYSVTYIAPIN